LLFVVDENESHQTYRNFC